MARFQKIAGVLFVFFCITPIILFMLMNSDTKYCGKTPTEKPLQTDYEALEEENMLLRDQILKLQQELRFIKTKSSKNLEEFSGTACGLEFQIKEKSLRTEVHSGQSFSSELMLNPFTRFTLWSEYPTIIGFNGKPHHKLSGVRRLEVDEVVDQGVTYLNENGTRNWFRTDFVEGIYRYDGHYGTHYQLNFLKMTGETSRVTLFRPSGPPLPVHKEHTPISELVNIIVPLAGRLDKLKLFLENSITTITKHSRFHLTIVYFAQESNEFGAMFQAFMMKHEFHRHTVKFVTDHPFSRGYALNIGIQLWKKRTDPIIFLCDVDVVFNENFIRRCETTAHKGKAVYYPIVFSLYNPQVVEQYYASEMNSWKQQLKIAEELGFWRDFGFGMACMYRSDYLSVGGFQLDIEGWGQEDVNLYKKFAASNMTVIRAADPDIFHLWHSKTCDKRLPDKQYRGCIRTKVLNEGSQIQLGYLLFADDIEQRRKYHEHL